MTTPRMRVLDLCSGTGSATKPFDIMGHKVVRVDLYPPKDAPADTLKLDVRTIAEAPERHLGAHFDHIHAGPPCDGFAVPSIGRMWDKDTGEPKHPTAKLGLEVMDACVAIIRHYRQRNAWLTYTLENPRAMMRRKLPERHPWMGKPKEVSYCRYGPLGPVMVSEGDPFVYAQKATDIWSNLLHWKPLKCEVRGGQKGVTVAPHKGRLFVYRDGRPCHERAARGTRAGIQRIVGKDHRGMMPEGLTAAIAGAAIRQHMAQSPP